MAYDIPTAAAPRPTLVSVLSKAGRLTEIAAENGKRAESIADEILGLAPTPSGNTGQGVDPSNGRINDIDQMLDMLDHHLQRAAVAITRIENGVGGGIGEKSYAEVMDAGVGRSIRGVGRSIRGVY